MQYRRKLIPLAVAAALSPLTHAEIDASTRLPEVQLLDQAFYAEPRSVDASMTFSF